MNESRLRDELANERTRLANERTLLAYVRTALALAAGGAAMLQFLPAYRSVFGVAWLLVGLGVVTVAIGVGRFVAVRRRLRG